MEKVSYERRERMNYMPEIAKMLGVEIGEEFKLRPYDKNRTEKDKHKTKRCNNSEKNHYKTDNIKYSGNTKELL